MNGHYQYNVINNHSQRNVVQGRFFNVIFEIFPLTSLLKLRMLTNVNFKKERKQY